MPLCIIHFADGEIDGQGWTGANKQIMVETWEPDMTYTIQARQQDAEIFVVLTDQDALHIKFKNGAQVKIIANIITFDTFDTSSVSKVG